MENTIKRLNELKICLEGYMTIYPQLAQSIIVTSDAPEELQAICNIVIHIKNEIDKLSEEVRVMQIKNGLNPTLNLSKSEEDNNLRAYFESPLYPDDETSSMGSR